MPGMVSRLGWFVGQAVLGGIVGGLSAGFLGFAVHVLDGLGWFYILEVLGAMFGGFGGWIGGLIAGADRMAMSRGPTIPRTWLLALSPLLIGAIFVGWSLGPARSKLFVPTQRPTTPAAPPASGFKPSSWWDIVNADAIEASLPIRKAIHDGFLVTVGYLFLMGFPLGSVAYGMFLGNRVVRFFLIQDAADLRRPGPGFEGFATET